jgi:hypothetical protein
MAPKPEKLAFSMPKRNFLDSNTTTGQNEGVEQGIPPYGAQDTAGYR